MKYTFIVNPHARSGMGDVIWKELEPELKKRQVEYECHQTCYATHATKLVAKITEDGNVHTLVALGGDGTVNEVINGIHDLEKVTFGYIPTGSGNDFAKGLKLPIVPLDALKLILNPVKIQKVDVGILTRAGKKRRFAISVGIGFDAAICHQSAVSKLKLRLNRLGLGRLTYVLISLNRLFHDTPVNAMVTLDDHEPRLFRKVYFVTAMNTPYEGGGFKFCPNAQFQDGMLDVIVLAGLPKLIALILLPTAYKGWHVHVPGVSIFGCKKVKVETIRPLALHTDGEPLFLRKEITAELYKSQLRVITM